MCARDGRSCVCLWMGLEITLLT
uniref:Xyloglucan endotransglucosylase/hydrolase protein 23 n=1 Tax=Arundo donax TaxID=35708 RepID=A0A0A9E8K2_ARUDO